jgi:prepilin-type processing-associated H-X9-DG protein
MKPRRSHGISKIEVMVVVAIFGILITLMMPAIGSARESSRRSQCRDRLRNLGLAMHNYHDSHKVFPPGIVGQNFGPADPEICQFVASSPTCDNPKFANASGLTLLLPFMDERGVYHAYNQQLASCAMENHTAVSSVVRGFVCPSNPRQFEAIELTYYKTPANAKRGLGPTDYVLSMGGVGVFESDNPFIYTGCGLRGVPGIMRRAVGAFDINSSSCLDRFKDGTANTFLMGESAGGAELYVGLVGKNIVKGGERMTGGSTRDFCDNAWSQGWISSKTGGRSQGFGSVFAATAWNAWYDSMGNLTDPANGANWLPYPINETGLRFNRPTWAANSRPSTDVIGTNGAALPSGLGSVQGFRSYHPNMAQFLMGDGSVRSISENVDARLLVAFSSVVGREPIAAEQ